MKKGVQNMGKLLAVSVVFTLTSCHSNNKGPTDTPTSGTVIVAVDETFAPVIQEETDVFESIYRSSEILAVSCPEVKAFNLLMADSVRMIVATRTLSEKEKSFFQNEKKIFPKEIKIATDGLAFIVNKINPDTLITTNAIQKILSGEIKTWSGINPKSKLGEMKVVFDNTESSTAQYAVSEICHGKLSTDISALNKNEEVINFVTQHPEAIGVIGVNWISSHRESKLMGFQQGIRVMAISKEETAIAGNSFQPYQAYLATGQYPYARSIFIVLTDPRMGLATGFSSFIASDRGQRIILKSGILPATQPVRLIQVKNQF